MISDWGYDSKYVVLALKESNVAADRVRSEVIYTYVHSSYVHSVFYGAPGETRSTNVFCIQ